MNKYTDEQINNLYSVLCELMYQSEIVTSSYRARTELDSGFNGMGTNILIETAGQFNGGITRNLPRAIDKARKFLDENPPPWVVS